MFRSILPFTLASLGLIIVLLARNMPLFAWEINDVTTDFPPIYEVDIKSTSWKVRLGEPLEPSFKNIVISKDKRDCNPVDVILDITRSQSDKELEDISLNTNNIIRPWATEWYAIGLVIFVVYIWVYTLLYKRPLVEAFGYTIIVGFLYLQVTQIVRVLLPRIAYTYGTTTECFTGTVSFTAKLSKIHVEMLLVFFIGILLELGAFGEMFRQIIRAVRRKL